MPDSWVMILSVGVAGAFGVLAMLNLLACLMRNEQVVFNLRCEVERLQADYARRMKEMRELESAGLKVIEAVPAVPSKVKAH